VTTTYTYDNNGNTLTSQEGSNTAIQYTYNALDEQTGVTGEDLTATYTYYPDGLRKTKTVNGVTTTYMWDEDRLVSETVGNVTTDYFYGLQLIARNNLIPDSVDDDDEGGTTAPTPNPGGDSKAGGPNGGGNHGGSNTVTYINVIEYYLHDGHGNVVKLIDEEDNSVQTYEYDAFGNQLNSNTDDTNPFRYCSEYFDDETSTYHLRARYYNPILGRFSQQDSHWNSKNSIYGDKEYEDYSARVPDYEAIAQSSNLYAYCANNPVLYKDSSGEVFGTIVDLASWGISLHDLIKGPSWTNAGFFIYDSIATLLPAIPGSKIYKTVTAFVDVKGFRQFVKGNFRHNLSMLVDIPQGLAKKFEAHHVLPQKFIDWFTYQGINIHDPRFGTWVDKDLHHKWSYEYNKKWKEFIAPYEKKKINPEKIFDFARELSEIYNFDLNF